MLQQYTLDAVAATSGMIVIVAISAGVLMHYLHAQYCSKHRDNAEKKHKICANILKFLALASFSVTGFFFGELINVGTSFYIARSHGMTPNPDTGEYDISYGEIMSLNRKSVKETSIDINDLKNKAIIYVRYDCPDCVILHEQLAEIGDMVFLSSRTDKGKAARELYNIELTEIPQGVYIDSEGHATIIKITQGSGDTLALDLQQIAILREMANRRE